MENQKQIIELQNQIEQLTNKLDNISQMLSQSNKQIADIHKALFYNNANKTREERKEQLKECMKARLIMDNIAKQTKRK